jgi:hypothetical protein
MDTTGIVIPHLWIVFAEQYGLPSFCGEGFNVACPQLPPEAAPTLTVDKPAPFPSWKSASWQLSFATANVTTLGLGEGGFQGKLDFELNFWIFISTSWVFRKLAPLKV